MKRWAGSSYDTSPRECASFCGYADHGVVDRGCRMVDSGLRPFSLGANFRVLGVRDLHDDLSMFARSARAVASTP